MMLWLIFSALLVYFLYINVYIPSVFWKRKRIPHAGMFPLLGDSLRTLLKKEVMADVLRKVYNNFSDERYLGIYSFTKPILCLRDLDLIKQLTVRDFDHFTDHLNIVPTDAEPFISGNLFSLKGAEWREMRAILSPCFTGSKMRAMFLLIDECAKDFAKHIEDQTTNEIDDVELKSILTKYTNDVIASAAFGVKCNSLADENNVFYKMGRKLSTFTTWMLLKIVLYSIAPTLMKFFKLRIFSKDLVNFFHQTVMETIKMREQQNIYRPDMMQLLMEAKNGRLKFDSSINIDAGFATVEESSALKKEKNTERELSDTDITSQALIFFVAGFESSATAMGFMMMEMASNPDVQERLRQEIDNVMAACEGKLSYEAVAGMKYLDQVVSETLRKWPPAIQTDRVCVKTYTINPIKPQEPQLTISEGTQLIIPVWAIHYDANYFPNPEKFDPDRFCEENRRCIVPGSYMPFGIGPRSCIGSRFALLEIKVMAVHLLSKFEIVATAKTSVPLRLAKTFNPVPEGGYCVGLKKRTSVFISDGN